MNKKQFQHFYANCELMETLSDNKILVRVKETYQLFILNKINCCDPLSIQNQYKQLQSTLKQQKQLYHQNIVSVIDYYCPFKSGQIIVLTEYSSHTLYDQHQIRIKNNQQFDIKQLQNITISVIKALNYFYDRNIGHGSLSLKDIVLDSSGIVKVVDPSLATSSPFLVNNNYFYSPELLIHNMFTIQCSSNVEDLDFSKNDIFVLALNVLQLGLSNRQINQCINYIDGMINYTQLQQYLAQFENKYTVELTILLSKMLQEDPHNRINLKQILQYIDKLLYENDDDSSQIENNIEDSVSQISKNKTVNSFLISNIETPYSSISVDDSSYLIQNPLSSKSTNKQRKNIGHPVIII